MLPKMLDSAFLYGEKRFMKRNNNRNEENSNAQSPSNVCIEDVLGSGSIDPRDKIERLISDNALQKDFLVKANSQNPELLDFFYLPLLYICLEPAASLAFDSVDIETMISNFGQVLKVINKEKCVYVLMRNNVECWLAVKVLNNTDVELPGKNGNQIHKLKVSLCFEDATVNHVYRFHHQEYNEANFILQMNDDLMEALGKMYKYISIFDIDVDDFEEEFNIKQRILGLKGSNIIRIQFLVEKACSFSSEQENLEEGLNIKVLVDRKSQNQLIIMSNNWNKFILAQKYSNELFAQIKEEFKFFQDQLQSLKESRVKRTDKFFQPLEIQYSYDTDS